MRTTVNALNRGEIVDVEGIKFKKVEGKLQSGDLYIAERNSGPKLLTVRVVEDDLHGSLVFPSGMGYVFNLDECVKVEEAL